MRRVLFFAIALVVLGSPVAGSARSIEVGFVFDGPWDENERIESLMQEAIVELLAGDFEVRFPPNARRTGDWTVEQAQADLQALIDAPEVDVVLTTGVIASAAAMRHDALTKPVIAPFVLDRELQELPVLGKGSGRANLHYLVMPRTIVRDVETFAQIVPFERLTLVMSRTIARVVPHRARLVERVQEALGQSVTLIEVDGVAETIAALPPDTDAVYVLPQFRSSRAELRDLADALIERRLPSFALLGRRDVELGLLMALNPDFLPKLSRRVALDLQSILLGDSPEDLSVAFTAGEQLVINRATADAIGVDLAWSALTEADLVGETQDADERQVDLAGAVREAIAVNLDLRAARLGLQADEQSTDRARSTLLPQVDLDLQYVVLDEDRAASSFGSTAERTLRGGLGLSQVIYSDEARAAATIEQRRQEGRAADFEAQRLDLAQHAATVYLQLLSAKTVERVRRDNVRLTRNHRELARVREFVGQSGPGEVLRLESQLASDIQDAIEANAERNVAEIELNRILHRPLEEGFQTRELGVDEPLDHMVDDGLSAFLRGKRSFGELRGFLAGVALESSPELVELEAAIRAQERALSSSGRAFVLPSVGLSAEWLRRFDEQGAGSEATAILGFDPADDTDWNVAVGLSYPLFAGGDRFPRRRQARFELERLQRLREATAERIEQRVRVALHRAGASWAGITQTQRAADAADRSLEVVTDAYGRGAVVVLDLLDAQNTLLTARLRATAAVYEFLVDLMEVERAMGTNQFLTDPEVRAALLRRCAEHFARRGLEVPHTGSSPREKP